MIELLNKIRGCTLCAPDLPLGPNPVVFASPKAKIAIIGQAPGTKVHKTNIPWNDPSGDELRRWMDIPRDLFYDNPEIAIVPMGFCYPGKGKSGDLPPRKECAPLWHEQIFSKFDQLQLILLIGQYSQTYYLQKRRKKNLTETVRVFEEYLPRYFVLPHPSPRNRLWRRKNPWFENEIVPALQQKVTTILKG